MNKMYGIQLKKKKVIELLQQQNQNLIQENALKTQ